MTSLLPLFTILCLVPLLYDVALTKKSTPTPTPQPSPPVNVLFVLTSNMGQWATSVYGNGDAVTPVLQQLAKEGTVFDNAFCNTPSSSPSRATIFSGRISSQTGINDAIDKGNYKPGYSYLEEEVLFTQNLRAENYTTGISGKWHLGNSQVPQQGFMHWFTLQTGDVNYTSPAFINCTSFWNNKRNRACSPYFSSTYATDVTTADAIEYLRRWRNRNDGFRVNETNMQSPFYLSVHFSAPQPPYVGADGKASSMHPPEYVDLYANSTFNSTVQAPSHRWAHHTNSQLTSECLNNKECLKGYYGSISALDASLGLIIDELETLGVRNNTLIVFTSDTGFTAGQMGFWGDGSGTYPLNVYDTNMKVPLIYNLPGTVFSQRRDEMVTHADIAPTLLDFLELPKISGSKNTPGSSYSSLLTSKGKKNWSQVAVAGDYGMTRMYRTSSMKLVQRFIGPNELFDLTVDPSESNNVIYNTTYAYKLHTMQLLLEEYFALYANPSSWGWDQKIVGCGQNSPMSWNNVTSRDMFCSTGLL